MKKRLEVGFLAGTLGQGGAEKQLVYMATALHEQGIGVRIYSLTQDEYYEQILKDKQIPVIHIPHFATRLQRMWHIRRLAQQDSIHILQATHFYVNLYAALAARFTPILDIGAIRNDALFEIKANGYLGKLSLHLPSALIVNSEVGRKNAIAQGVSADKLSLIRNVIDLQNFENMSKKSGAEGNAPAGEKHGGKIRVMLVARLRPEKRVERFLQVMAQVKNPAIEGVIVGDGSQRPLLEKMAQELKVNVQFLGLRDDIPALLSSADIVMLTSQHEGFPNVLMEAMAASMPVITTPAGDAVHLVNNSGGGYIADEVETMAKYLLKLASSPELRTRMGVAGRQYIEKNHNYKTLAMDLINTYRHHAQRQKKQHLLRILDGF